MMRILLLFVMLNLICATSASAADPPSQTYDELGFDTVKVFDFKKALREEGKEVPRFPLKTNNALIVDGIYRDSRAKKAGLEYQDLIIEINGKVLKSFDEGDKLLQKNTYKDELKLRVVRREDDKWNWMDVTIKPVSELEHLRARFSRKSKFDETYQKCVYINHNDDPESKYTGDNFRLYIREKTNQPLKIYLQIVQFHPRKKIMLDELTKAGFVIQTDTEKYLAAEMKADLIQIKHNEKELTKLIQQLEVAKKKVADAEEKKSEEEAIYLEAVKEYETIAAQYQKSNTEQLRFLDKAAAAERAETEVNLNRFLSYYERLPGHQKKLLDRLLNVLDQKEKFPDVVVYNAEQFGLADPQIAKARENQGWKHYDAPLKKEQLKMIEDIINSKSVIVVFENAPEKTLKISPEKKARMKEVLELFEAEGGKLGE